MVRKKATRLMALLLSTAMLFAGCADSEDDSSSGAKVDSEPTTLNLTAQQVTEDMGNGWNLGNTMEAVATWLGSSATPNSFETAWGQPITTEAMMKGLADSGIESIRIPVAWSNMISDTNVIDPAYITRIDEIVGYVLNNGMYAIVNIHWDNGWWENFGSDDEAVRKAAMDKYTAIWTQLSEHYKDYSYKLILESANEELGDKVQGTSTVDEAYTRTNEINQTFVNIVRASGGRNTDRCLLIAGFNTDIQKTCDPRYVMPTDTAQNKLIVSVHYYTPSTYCIASEVDNSWGYKAEWGSDSDKKEMDKYLSMMKKFTDAGFGVIIGEYGVCEIKQDGQNVLKPGAADFVSELVKLSEQYGYCPMLWDTGAFYNRTGAVFNDAAIADIFKK